MEDIDDSAVKENLILHAINGETEQNQSITQKNEEEINKSKNFFLLLRHNKEYRWKFIKTLMLCWSFFNYGLTVGLLGPSLLDLVEITKSTLSKISSVMTATGVGYMSGAIITGIVDDRIHSDFLSFLSCLGSSVATLVIPWCSILEIMIFVFLFKGVMAGIQDPAANALLLRLWKDERSSYMQALHFSWSVGSILSPLYITPFLSEVPSPTSEDDQNNGSLFHNDTYLANQFGSDNLTHTMAYLTNQSYASSRNYSRLNEISSSHSIVYIPYTFTGLVFMTAPIFFLIGYIQETFIWKNSENTERNKKVVEKKSKQKIRNCIKTSREFILPKLAWLNILLMMLFYVSIEAVFGGLSAAFAVKMLKWTKVNGSYLTAVYAGSFCFGRILSIFVVRFIRTSRILIFNCSVLCVAITGYLISAIFTFEIGIWVTTSVAGVFASPIFPGILTWAEEEFVTMSRRVTSSILVASSIGWMTIPTIVGTLMDTVSPMFFAYFLLGLIIIVIILYITASLFSRVIQKYRNPSNKNVSLKV